MESSLIALTADYISITDMSLWWCTWVVLCYYTNTPPRKLPVRRTKFSELTNTRLNTLNFQ